VQERALAAAGRTDDGNEFVLIDREIELGDRRNLFVAGDEGLVEVLHLQKRHDPEALRRFQFGR
jgi:hypothetical protein